ncbi:PREDICTED: uncharacterized protein LOC106810575 [Priapulus caudatus]|uniref:Uncharacterized protein LOC106810575 n=1 Tax=Priapulus caudatus TaxID=37621 RepID=A0ABM1EB83_PRICU|nr:PREDICTED: uncharacterized protein LOC106810575 [Priapulus caudatus]
MARFSSDVETIIKALNLQRHPIENGYWRLVFDSPCNNYSSTHQGEERETFSYIYYLLETTDWSPWHRMKGTQEFWTHHKGGTLQIHMILPDGTYHLQQLGDPFVDAESSLDCVIPPDTWFALDMKDKASYTLAISCCVPGFDQRDMEMLTRKEMVKIFPQHQIIIEKFTNA